MPAPSSEMYTRRFHFNWNNFCFVNFCIKCIGTLADSRDNQLRLLRRSGRSDRRRSARRRNGRRAGEGRGRAGPRPDRRSDWPSSNRASRRRRRLIGPSRCTRSWMNEIFNASPLYSRWLLRWHWRGFWSKLYRSIALDALYKVSVGSEPMERSVWWAKVKLIFRKGCWCVRILGQRGPWAKVMGLRVQISAAQLSQNGFQRNH